MFCMTKVLCDPHQLVPYVLKILNIIAFILGVSLFINDNVNVKADDGVVLESEHIPVVLAARTPMGIRPSSPGYDVFIL